MPLLLVLQIGDGGEVEDLCPDREPEGGRGVGEIPSAGVRHPGPGRHDGGRGGASRELQRQAWHWALAHRASDGSLPNGRQIADQYGRHERWGRLVKHAGAAGEFTGQPSEPAQHLVGQQPSPAAGE